VSSDVNPVMTTDELMAVAVGLHRPTDSMFAEPYIDTNEWRDDEPPVRARRFRRHRSALRLFPAGCSFEGRFLHVLP
jgi:hypothetical protein